MYLYNTEQDVDILAGEVEKILRLA